MPTHKNMAQACISTPRPQALRLPAHAPVSLQQCSMQTRRLPHPHTDQMCSLAVTVALTVGLSQQLLICIAKGQHIISNKAWLAMTRSLGRDNQRRRGEIALHTITPAVRSLISGETHHPCRCLGLHLTMTGSSSHSSPRMAMRHPPQLPRPAQGKLQVKLTGSWDSSIMQRRLETPKTHRSRRVRCQHRRRQAGALVPPWQSNRSLLTSALTAST